MPPIAPLAAGALIAGGSALVSGIGNWFSGKSSARKQFKYQQQLNQEAYDRDLEFWNIQNAYNSPDQQVRRLKEAGLNPHLVYGGSAGSVAGNSSQGVSANAGSAPAVDYTGTPGGLNPLNSLAQFQAIRTQSAAIDKTKAEVLKVQADALNSAARLGGTKANSALAQLNYFQADAVKHDIIQQIQNDTQRKSAETDRAFSEAGLSNIAFKRSSDLYAGGQVAQELQRGSLTNEAIRRDNERRMLENNLRALGINPTGSGIETFLARLLGQWWSTR